MPKHPDPQPLIDACFDILVQSPAGLRLIETADAADYTVVLTQGEVKGETDHRRKFIYLALRDDPRQMALTLAHELAHVSQHVAGFDIHISADHPVSALKKMMAAEADARAQEMGVALELTPCVKGILDLAVAESENRLVAKLMGSLAPGTDPQRVMAACFKAFYGDSRLRGVYEDVVMGWLEGLAPEVIRNPGCLTRETTSAELIACLEAQGKAYLTRNLEDLDLDRAPYLAIGSQTLSRLQALEAIRHEEPATRSQSRWEAPVYSSPSQSKMPPKGLRH